MFLFYLYFIKTLKRINILNRFNFALNISINSNKVKIPFIYGIGLTNYILKSEWLDSLIKGLKLDEDGFFVDVGTNIGQSLIRLKTIKPNMKYMGFEPNSMCISYVQQLIKINSFTNCFVQNCALSSITQSLILEKSADDDAGASVVPSLRPGFFTHKESILSLDFDSYFTDTKITFIKIDVEGAELDVLKGMKNSISRHQPVIICEVLDSFQNSVLEFTQHRANQLTELIFSLNYSIVRLQTDTLNQTIVAYNKIDNITIKQWTTDSYNYNDYLFYPNNKEIQVLGDLNIMCL